MKRFNEIASLLLNKSVLRVNGVIFHLVEIEFYLHSEEHPDPYVHCHPIQKIPNAIYFHRSAQTMNSKYKGGTFKGMDLVFSDGKEYFGVLIRSVRCEDTYINGPCCAVNEIIKTLGVTHLEEIYSLNEIPLFTEGKICLLPYENYLDIYQAPRWGLKNKSEEWTNKLYRFATCLKNVKGKKTFALMEKNSKTLE